MINSTPNYKILIAEDDPTIQFLYHALLAPLAILTILSNGKQAQQALTQSQDYNLVITDNNMPILTGLELLASLPDTITIPRFMISATPDSYDLHQTVQQHGALGLYQKPFNCAKEFRTITSELLQHGQSPTLNSYFKDKYN